MRNEFTRLNFVRLNENNASEIDESYVYGNRLYCLCLKIIWWKMRYGETKSAL